MQQYLNLLQNILDNGVEKESGRANMPNTIGISNGIVRMDLQEGFPLLTTKKMYLKGIIHELLWFLRGETNIKYLIDNNVNIWNGDAYRWYLKFTETLQQNDLTYLSNDNKPLSIENFIAEIKNRNIKDLSRHKSGYMIGDLGKVYGYQWRNQNGVDQVKEVLDGLKSNPYSRYHIIDAWNKADFKEMALPPCHLLYQFIVRPLSVGQRFEIFDDKLNVYEHDLQNLESHMDDAGVPKFFLDLNMYQRSCDTFLGVPFNLASMSLLLMLFAEVSGMLPGVATWIGGDTHLYVDHIPVVREQLKREPYDLPRLIITKEFQTLEDILGLTVDDFELIDYTWHPAIKAELFTGVKK